MQENLPATQFKKPALVEQN